MGAAPTPDDQDNADVDSSGVVFLKEKLLEAVREGDAEEIRCPMSASLAPKLLGICDESSGWSLLHFSCSRGHLNITQTLLDAGADPLQACDKLGKTCLHVAIEHDSRDIVRLLLKRNPANQWPKTSKLSLGQTAARVGCVPAMLDLLQNGMDPNDRGQNNETPLHVASRYGHHMVIEVLLQHGAEVHVREAWAGRTPLHYACIGGHMKACMALITMGGADAHICDMSGSEHTPLETAVVSGYRGLSHQLVLLVDSRRRAAERKEEAANAASLARHEATLLSMKATRRRVSALKGEVAVKRSLARMEKRQMMENLGSQIVRARNRLGTLQARYEHLQSRIDLEEKSGMSSAARVKHQTSNACTFCREATSNSKRVREMPRLH